MEPHNDASPTPSDLEEPASKATGPLGKEEGDDMDALVTRALLARPGVSIRARLTIGFLVIFFVALGATAVTWVIVFRLDDKLEFVARADQFANEIQQCRRYEKNFFLYGSDLADLMKHLQAARSVLVGVQAELGRSVGAERLQKLEQDLEAYNNLVFELMEIHRQLKPGGSVNRPEIEKGLRQHGARLVDTALMLSREERENVRKSLHLMRRWDMVSLIILLAVMVYMANFLSRHLLKRLDFLVDVTRRIGEGDFTPIMPVRRYRDEFTRLSLAMNRMMQELVRRHEQLVQAKKIAAIGTLTAGVAHEINNPVNNISLILESLLEAGDTMDEAERRKLYEEGMEQCERVSDIVRNLLEFSRATHPRKVEVSLEEVVDKTVKLVANELRLHDIRFSKEVRDELPELHVDKGGLQQVLLNLFLNAIQAMPNGGELRVVIRMGKGMNEGVIEVSDTGVGIEEKHLDKIFDPFFTTKQNGQGTGLGLSVSHSIIEKHGGRMEVRSKVGQGTTFTIYLPFERPPY